MLIDVYANIRGISLLRVNISGTDFSGGVRENILLRRIWEQYTSDMFSQVVRDFSMFSCYVDKISSLWNS